LAEEGWQIMKAFSKAGMLAAVALLATAAVATSAQAATFNPDNTAVSARSVGATVSMIVCPSVALEGNTGLDSDSITDLVLEFQEPCSAGGQGVTTDCLGTMTLIADPDADDTGTGELNEGFQCTFTTALCSFTVAGPQKSQPKNTMLDEQNDILSVAWDFRASRSGSPMCGPEETTFSITGEAVVAPADLTIDP
jgi:hypothetical protein